MVSNGATIVLTIILLMSGGDGVVSIQQQTGLLYGKEP